MLNKVILQGRLTADPELRYTQSNIPVASFRIAVDRSRATRDASGNRQNQADFFSVVAWRQTGEFVSRNFARGSMILVEGQLRMREYTDRDGNRRTTVEILADNVNFCGSRKERGTDGSSIASETGDHAAPSGSCAPGAAAAEDAFSELMDDDGELPF